MEKSCMFLTHTVHTICANACMIPMMQYLHPAIGTIFNDVMLSCIIYYMHK